jgi:hypothetical protein
MTLERALWALLEAHANMDMAYITELESDRTIQIFQAKPWEGSTDVTVRDLSRRTCYFARSEPNFWLLSFCLLCAREKCLEFWLWKS